MEFISLNGFEYFHHRDGNYNVIFFSAKGKDGFNINTEEGLNNLQAVKRLFELEDLGYCVQTHSDITWIYDGSIKKGML